MELLEKIHSRKARTGVIGLGYVGLPLAIEFAHAGFRAVGIDVDQRKVDAVNAGTSYIVDTADEEIASLVATGRLVATNDFSVIADCDTINICVPTPLRKTKDPDMTFILAAVGEIKKYIRPGQLVILESTTYPGTTDEVVLPALEEAGLKVGHDFFLAFSPERIDPGNKQYQTRNIPKVVGGVTAQCTQVAKTLYEQSIDSVVPVSSTRVAEMVKLLENTFRSVNIGLVNELALMSAKLGINVWEVIDAAATKPFGFMPFYPGPGLGGHCIPIDPFYLGWKAKMNGFEPRFIELAGQINEAMPKFVVDKVTDALNNDGKAVRNSRVHVLGVAYKRDVNDVRESPALHVIKMLVDKGAKVTYSDPYAPTIREEGMEMSHLPVREALEAGTDCVVLLTDHGCFNYPEIVHLAPMIVDTRNALRDFIGGNIIRL
ncbi:MAG: nucleotide sugar dehydrogenase [Deltaproteobacteria bacterium]|nr:nucleotide sugar dehydrogenase [Deltaproteobacteria bacterium]